MYHGCSCNYSVRKTVRKKSRKGITISKSHQTIAEEEPSKIRKSSDPNISRQKPEIAPRKFSSSNNNSPNLNRLNTPVGGVNTPPRPRQTLIYRASSKPNDEEQQMDDRRKDRMSPSKFINGRSPSPARKPSPGFSPRQDRRPSPSSSPLQGRRLSPIPGGRPTPNHKIDLKQLNGTNTQETTSITNGLSDDNPYTQVAAETLIKYVLASHDPSLKAALIKIVSSDPDILKALNN